MKQAWEFMARAIKARHPMNNTWNLISWVMLALSVLLLVTLSAVALTQG